MPKIFIFTFTCVISLYTFHFVGGSLRSKIFVANKCFSVIVVHMTNKKIEFMNITNITPAKYQYVSMLILTISTASHNYFCSTIECLYV